MDRLDSLRLFVSRATPRSTLVALLFDMLRLTRILTTTEKPPSYLSLIEQHVLPTGPGHVAHYVVYVDVMRS